MTEPALSPPANLTDLRETSLQDLLQFLRSQILVIAVAVIFSAGATLVYTGRQPVKYQGTASLSAMDPSQDLAVVGGVPGALEQPATLALREAQVLLRPEILQVAAQRLGPGTSPVTLAHEVTATTEPTSSLISVTATTRTAASAAATANSVAQAAVDRETLDQRTRFKNSARELRTAFQALSAADRRNPATQSDYNTRISRLDALAAVATPLAISEGAKIPTGPATTSRVVTVIIGGFVGLLIGLAAGALRNALDRRLRGPDEIESLLNLPTIGHVREAAMGKAGVDGMSPNPLLELDLERFQIMRANLEFLARDRTPIKTVLVTSASPQEGKSTVAASLALALAQSGSRMLLLECDLRRPSLALRHGLLTSPGLREHFAGSASLSDIVHPLPITPSVPNGASAPERLGGLDCILAGSSCEGGSVATLLRSDEFAELMRVAREAYDSIIIDSAPLLPVVDTLELLGVADAAILCVRDGQTTRDQAQAATALLVNMGDRPVALAVTGVKPTGTGYGAHYGYGYSYPRKG